MDKTPDHEEAMTSIVKNEIEIMTSISHKSIVNLLSYSLSDLLVKPNGDSKEVYYLALELAVGGELFDFLSETGAFSEELTRYYFKQLINVFAYLNENGISHRDIKPENMMFDHEYNLKLADFGFSSNKALNCSKKGTLSYMAPEVMEGCAYNGHTSDLFSLGIIMFLMRSKHSPFLRATSSDQYYRLLMGNREDLFWLTHSRNKPDNYYSPGFKDMIQWLFAYNPMERPSIAEIMEHEWYKGPVPSHKDVIQIIEQRKFDASLENYHPDAQTPSGSPDPSILGDGEFRCLEEKKIDRRIAPYTPELQRYSKFFSAVEPDKLFEVLALYAEKK